ncbi:MAG: hypothetical protein K8R41_06785 [Bacteroidales bacterium]|nr:hypothetical protein [Bacteroidales bacterium]MCD4773073.1 hypothetical protein [Bacteroidales bacterium]
MANIFSFLASIFKKKDLPGTVKYVLGGTANSYNITFKDFKKQTIQKPEVKNGWTKSFVGKPGDYYYASAQANNRNAIIELSVFYDGEIINETSKSGDYALATISGTLS